MADMIRPWSDQDLEGTERTCRSSALSAWPGTTPTRELEKLIVSRKLAHGGNPVTRWMAANVAVAQDPAGNLKPAKDKSTERIDGIVALIMAIGRAILAHDRPACTPMAVWV
jgi:phage terminase large subunit-like protein